MSLELKHRESITKRNKSTTKHYSLYVNTFRNRLNEISMSWAMGNV